MIKPHTGELVFFWILFGIVGILAFAVMSPYITPLFLAMVLSILFFPLHRRVSGWFPKKKGTAAGVTVGIVLCAVMIPLVFLGILMFQEVWGIYNTLQPGSGALAFADRVLGVVETHVRKVIPSFEVQDNLFVYLEAILGWVASHLNTFFSGILSFIFQIFLVAVAMFFFYRDGDKLRDFAVKWSPLADSYDESIIAKLEAAISSVVTGALTTAIVQGTLVGIGFAIFGVPNPVLWGAFAMVTALIPMVGTGIITMPTGAWLLLTGHIGAGVGVIIWGLLLVGLIDNVMNPYIVTRGVNIHPLIVLLSIFGGLAYFGLIGFLAGPIILAFFFALMDIYPQIIKGRAIEDGTPAA